MLQAPRFPADRDLDKFEAEHGPGVVNRQQSTADRLQLHVELLAELPAQPVLDALPGLELAPGKLPQLRTEIAARGTEIAGLRGEVRTGLEQVRTELLRWMFGFWVSTLIGIAGLLIALRGP